MSGQRGSILISGAGRGIGRATAQLFLSRGWRVGLYDVDVDADAAADAAGSSPAAVHGVLDVRDPDQWRAVLRDFCGDGGLDVLVNNAGVLASGPFVAIDGEAHRRMVDVNVGGVINGAVAGHPCLRRARRGLLLNLCSASALYGQPSLATYGATKAAVKSLTEALDIEWRGDGVREHGIRVRSLLPLFVATEMVSRAGRRRASPGWASGSPPRTSRPRHGRSSTSAGGGCGHRSGRWAHRPACWPPRPPSRRTGPTASWCAGSPADPSDQPAYGAPSGSTVS